jgi:hypothetical protein
MRTESRGGGAKKSEPPMNADNKRACFDRRSSAFIGGQ